MTFEDEMRAALENFSVEAADLLVAMETGLLELEGGAGDPETINSVFRAAHTVKGSAGLFGLDDIVAFTHVMESVLDRLRSGEIEVSSGLIGTLLPCADHLGLMIQSIGADAGSSAADPDRGVELVAALRPFLAEQAEAAGATFETAGTADTPGPADHPTGRLHLSLRFGPDCLRGGMDPLSFISYLRSMGDVTSVHCMEQLLPDAKDFDPESCYLAFHVGLRTDETPEAVGNVFEFVREESDIRVLQVGGPIDEFASLVDSFGEHAEAAAEILVLAGAVDASALAAALGRPQPASSGEAAPEPATPEPAQTQTQTAQTAQTQTAESPAASTPAPAAQPAVPAQRTVAARSEAQYIRVDADRLDRLIDAVGELVIAGAGASLRAQLSGDELLETSVGEVMRLVEEVRDSTLQLRMVPIGTTFSRFQRVVRDVSAALGKDVTLAISGGDTEVDKALVEQIGDPLMHLVRNALDHGVESREKRLERGKSPRGTLRLNAFHDSGSIVIEVSDDGGGIDAQRVQETAIERGVIEPDAQLSEQEAFQLIFEPGFSTSASISDLSGRGVGMDVVRRNVTALRGTIEVQSRPGQGTTFRIRLPLTLAIIDGFMVGVGSTTFVIPLDRVNECVELPVEAGRSNCMDLRGEVLPYVRLRSLFDIPGERPKRENVVVVEHAGTRTGLVVDALRGEFQTVIKPLGQLFENVRGVGGSTILGNGDVALILDVSTLVRHATETLNGGGGHRQASLT